MNANHHVVPWKIYLATFIALVGLTLITVLTARVDLGDFNVPLALSIAVAKATLVVMFFMGQRWENGFNRFVFVSTIVFFLIFVFFTLADTMFRGLADGLDGQVYEVKKIISDEVSTEDH